MFFGRYFHQIDQKGRMRLPSKLRQEMGDKIHVIQGSSAGCLFIFSDEEFNAFTEKLVAVSIYDETKQKPVRQILTSGVVIEEDNQGRFLLPPYLRQFAELKKDIVFMGVGKRVELWSQERWDAYNNVSEEEYAESMAVLAELGL
jgi:MraZ protein